MAAIVALALQSFAMAGLSALPDEVLSLICEELGSRRDFSTLFQCALCNVAFAEPALRTMYRLHELSPAFSPSDDLEALRQKAPGTFADKDREYQQMTRNWTTLWRSIILSSYSSIHNGQRQCETYKPYCRYIRALNFRNLQDLFQERSFTGGLQSHLFEGLLQSLKHSKDVLYGRTLQKTKLRKYAHDVIDVVATINAIGEVVTQETTLLEEISGFLSPGFLPRWIARSPRLSTMTMWKGDALRNDAEVAIRNHCNFFSSLTIYEWSEPNNDRLLAKFLTGLPENTLQHLEIISQSDIGIESFKALSSMHSKSLRTLKLSSLTDDALKTLNELKRCKSIRNLILEDRRGGLQLEATQNDIFEEVVEWLCACANLRNLTFRRLYDGPGILARVLSSPSVKLKRLSVEGYALSRSTVAAFHASLSSQRSLQSLLLKGDATDGSAELMVEAICDLVALRELHLKDISDEFTEFEIMRLASALPNLEEFWNEWWRGICCYSESTGRAKALEKSHIIRHNTI